MLNVSILFFGGMIISILEKHYLNLIQVFSETLACEIKERATFS